MTSDLSNDEVISREKPDWTICTGHFERFGIGSLTALGDFKHLFHDISDKYCISVTVSPLTTD